MGSGIGGQPRIPRQLGVSIRLITNPGSGPWFAGEPADDRPAARLLGFALTPILPIVVPPVLRLLPFLKSIGDSTPGDSVRFLLVVTGASAFGASGYWFLVRWFWLKPLKFVDLVRTITLCVIATSLAFVIPAVLISINRDVAGYLPTVLWWFAFSGSLYWSESSGNNYSHVGNPALETA